MMKKRTYELFGSVTDKAEKKTPVLTFGFSAANPDEIIFLVKNFWGRFKATSPKGLCDLTDFAGELAAGNMYAEIELELDTAENEIYFLSICPGKVEILSSERTVIRILQSDMLNCVEEVTGTVIIP